MKHLFKNHYMKDVSVSIIIPAHNEKERISDILNQLNGLSFSNEIIVVDDASKDGTGDFVKKNFAGVKVITHETNKGKFQAMKTGVEESKGDIILFLDADLQNFQKEFVEDLTGAVIKEGFQLSIAYREGEYWVARFVVFNEPYLAGERCMKKDLFNKILKENTVDGYEIEVIINKYILDNNIPFKIIDCKGLHNYMKYKKFGLFKGMYKEIQMINRIVMKVGLFEMIRQVCKISIRYHMVRFLQKNKISNMYI